MSSEPGKASVGRAPNRMSASEKPSRVVTLWMSFSDPDRPVGEQFLGVCVIDVTDAEAAAAVPRMRAMFPKAKDGAEWLFVAMERSHQLGINPGGSVGSAETPRDVFDQKSPGCPRDRLMLKPELVERGLI